MKGQDEDEGGWAEGCHAVQGEYSILRGGDTESASSNEFSAGAFYAAEK
jgi:hypothetical protein